MIATAKMITTTFAELARDRRLRSLAVDVFFEPGFCPSTALATDLPMRPDLFPGAHSGDEPSLGGGDGGVFGGRFVG
ncbi:MAG: hypothetical protein ACI9G1_000940 [Pirellulaceae bacterium]|jgi:hypothetical protein